MAAVDLQNLDEETVRSIDRLFERWKHLEPGSSDAVHWVPREDQATVITRIGVEAKSVNRQIASVCKERIKEAIARRNTSKHMHG